MSMVEAGRKACEALIPRPGEAVAQFAERLYNAQLTAYDEYCAGMLPGYPPFARLSDEAKQGWVETATRLLNPNSLHYDAQRKSYLAPDGRSVAREFDTLTPNGNPMSGRWVLRDAAGALIDFDQFRNDLAEHNNLRLLGGE